VLSKIKVAQISKKKIIKFKVSCTDLLLLDGLWKNGFIHGYKKLRCSYIIFLRYASRGLGLLNSIIFLDSKVSNKQLKTLISLDSYYSYLVLTCKGIFIYSTSDLVKHGGKLIAKF